MPIDSGHDRNIYGDPAALPDTGVRNGRLTPGPAATLTAWFVVLAVIALPLVF